ncbi:MAG: tRNA (cytosine(32)/uridine(32)-2'-O)-methyltransferase TrmJ [Gammaproteobacteria bacterium]|nr:tRNA (cytosine(32)/uridine(32)-2'-O)-methyltransferase TrmJ [Gammaproteobacteria bacterium]
MQDKLRLIRVVLVGTSHPGNIGMVARAMKTMGLTDLVLLNPEKMPDETSISMSSNADDIVTNAKIVSSLEVALEGCGFVLGASARERYLAWPQLSSREAGEFVAGALEGDQSIALVFGRERTGLTNEELERCHYHVHIPCNPEYRSLNLAMAVQVLAYECRMALLGSDSKGFTLEERFPLSRRAAREVLASSAETEGLYQHLNTTLQKIGFIDPRNPRKLLSRLRRLFQRAQVTQVEVNILRGILTAVETKSLTVKKGHD